MATTLILTGNSSVITSNYFPPIELEGQYECCLIDFHMYNSIPNVDSENNLFHIGDFIIEIPVGSYELSDITDIIMDKIKENNGIHTDLSIESNNNTLQVYIHSKNNPIYFDRDRTIGGLLGFKKRALSADKTHVSDLPVNIMRVNTIRVECGIVTDSYVNNIPAHVLHEFGIDVPPGYKMDVIPKNLIYLPVTTNRISSLTISIVDQNGNLINLRGEEVTLRLHLRPRQQ